MATDRHVRSRRWASSYFPRHSCFAMHISFILARLNWNASKKPIAYAIHHHFPFHDFRICGIDSFFFPLHWMRKLD